MPKTAVSDMSGLSNYDLMRFEKSGYLPSLTPTTLPPTPNMQPTTDTSLPQTEVIEQWAILEIMGHERLAGRVCETLIAGTKLLQVDVPASDKLPAFTRLLSPTALFSMTPVPEAVARVVAGNLQKTAVSGIASYGYTLGQQQEMRQALGLPAPNQAQMGPYDCQKCGRDIGPADGCQCNSDDDRPY